MVIEAVEERRSLRGEFMDRLTQELPARELGRIEAMLAIWCRETQPELQPLQGMLHDTWMPGLSTTAWFEPEAFDFIAELERHYEATRRGYYEALTHRRLLYYSNDPLSGVNRRVPHFPEGWKQFPLAHATRVYPDNLAYFPFLARLHRRLVQEERAPKTLSFLVIEPNTIIRDHVDPKNFFVTIQFGISVPAGDCFLRAGPTKHAWQPGKCFAFDNSFYHSAWNYTGEDRIVLAIHTYHPQLTRTERRALDLLARSYQLAATTRRLEGNSGLEGHNGLDDYNPWC